LLVGISLIFSGISRLSLSGAKSQLSVPAPAGS
jgi:hypothetical protein